MTKHDLDGYGARRGYDVHSGNYRATMVDTGMGRKGWQIMDLWVSGGSTRETGPEELYTQSEAERMIKSKFAEWSKKGIR